MTVCIAVKTSEGLVLAADSAATITNDKGQVLSIFQYGSKLLQLGDHPMGIMSWGGTPPFPCRMP